MRAWDEFLKDQESELGKETVEKWLRSLKVTHFDACNLYLEAKDSFQSLWFEEHIRTKAIQKLVNSNGKRIHIHLKVAKATYSKSEDLSPHNKRVKKNHKDNSQPFKLNFEDLNPHLLLENFVVTEENRIPYQLISELATNPSTQEPSASHFNPIFLHGSTGCGKTHLLSALAHALGKMNKKCLFVRSELFTDHVVMAIRAGEMSLFRQAYRNADVLLIDDVHIFSRRGTTQEEFFHTFNALHLEGKQIILTANCHPQELNAIEPRLISRFEWGITLPLFPLKSSAWRDLLVAKTNTLNFPLPQRIIDFLCASFTGSPKSLIRALEALILRLHINHKSDSLHLTTQAAKTLLSDLLAEEMKNALTPSKIIQIVAEKYHIAENDILGKSQKREYVLPRQLAMYLCREKLHIPYIKIGDLFARDHSTVMTSVKAIQKLVNEESVELLSAIHSISKSL